MRIRSTLKIYFHIIDGALCRRTTFRRVERTDGVNSVIL